MRVAKVLSVVERRAPRLTPLLRRWFVERGVPLNRAIGVRVDHVASDSSRVVLRLPLRRGNLNVGGTVHGAAIAAELARTGSCDVRLTSEVADAGGKTVARLDGSYVIRRRRADGP